MKDYTERNAMSAQSEETPVVFDESMCFTYGYTCYDCPYFNSHSFWCNAWNMAVKDPNREADGCSKRPAHPNR